MLYYETIVEFDDCNTHGYSLTIFFSKCTHRCEGCHNPSTWSQNFNSKLFTKEVEESVLSHFKSNEQFYDNLCLSGGDPMHPDNITDITSFVDKFKALFPNKEVWLYTGFDIDNIFYDTVKLKLFNKCDYVKCGRYIKDLKCKDNIQYNIKLATSNQNIYKINK